MQQRLVGVALVLLAGVVVHSTTLPNATCSGNFSTGICLHNAYPILKSFSADSPAACCSNCTADPKCVSWNINTGMKTCFLRGSYKPNPGPTCISGQVRAGPPAPPAPPPPPPPPPPSAECNATTALLQAALDAAAARGGGWARVPCGFHATLALQLPSRVKLGSTHCVGAEAVEAANRSSLLTLGACDPVSQDHIIAVMGGTGQAISGVIFDHSNFTKPSQAVTSGGVAGLDNTTDEFNVGSTGFVLENCQFLNIATYDKCPPPKCQHTNGMQGYSAIGLSGCIGCVIRGNHVPHSGGDALNFNSGEYIVTENTVENTGDGCIAMNNNAFGTVSNNVLRRCNLGIGAGPSGGCNLPCPPQGCDQPCGNPRGTGGDTNSTPFIVTGNTIEDCDYGMLLGWFGYKGRLGPMNTVISSNVVRRSRQAGIQYRGDEVDGAVIIQGNQVIHSGYPNQVPPGPESRRPIDPNKPGYGRGIYAWAIQDVQINGNLVSHSLGPAISSVGAKHVVISSNLLVADGANMNTTGVEITGSTDVVVQGNDARGFRTAIGAPNQGAKSDRIQIRGNSLDATGGGEGISVGSDVKRVVIAGNTIMGGGCVSLQGANASTRVQRDNECW